MGMVSCPDFKILLEHVGHALECVFYGPAPDPVNVAIECLDCGCVVLDIDRDDQVVRSVKKTTRKGKSRGRA